MSIPNNSKQIPNQEIAKTVENRSSQTGKETNVIEQRITSTKKTPIETNLV